MTIAGVNTLSVIKHGIEVFGSKEDFSAWLEKKNFFFDNKSPIDFMDTNSSLKFIDERLTALEFGYNV